MGLLFFTIRVKATFDAWFYAYYLITWVVGVVGFACKVVSNVVEKMKRT